MLKLVASAGRIPSHNNATTARSSRRCPVVESTNPLFSVTPLSSEVCPATITLIQMAAVRYSNTQAMSRQAASITVPNESEEKSRPYALKHHMMRENPGHAIVKIVGVGPRRYRGVSTSLLDKLMIPMINANCRSRIIQ